MPLLTGPERREFLAVEPGNGPDLGREPLDQHEGVHSMACISATGEMAPI
jgi:hypothetical protein